MLKLSTDITWAIRGTLDTPSRRCWARTGERKWRSRSALSFKNVLVGGGRMLNTEETRSLTLRALQRVRRNPAYLANIDPLPLPTMSLRRPLTLSLKIPQVAPTHSRSKRTRTHRFHANPANGRSIRPSSSIESESVISHKSSCSFKKPV